MFYGSSAKTKQASKMMHFPHIAGFYHQTYFSAQPFTDQMVMHG